MRGKDLILSVFASLSNVVASVAGAQTAPTAADGNKEAAPRKKEPTKVYHAGGKHDQRAHEASVRAQEAGKKMEEPAVHPGGKHDVQGHKAALKAEQKADAASKK